MSRKALDLLCVYGEDSSSEDEVPYGRVSTKRCHKDSDNIDENRPKKSLKSPKFSFPVTLKLDKEEHLEDSLLHEGRTRSFAHERGNWASYVYVSCQNNVDIELTICRICDKLSNFNFKSINDLHVSLTKVFILKHHWIESFVDTIKENINGLNRFLVMFDDLNVYCNEERTRTFIGLEIKTGYDSLLNIIGIMDRCLGDFNLPKFYKDPSFHMSLVWCLGDREEAIKNVLPELNEELSQMKNDFDQSNWYIFVDHLQCKIGNKLFSFHIS